MLFINAGIRHWYHFFPLLSANENVIVIALVYLFALCVIAKGERPVGRMIWGCLTSRTKHINNYIE